MLDWIGLFCWDARLTLGLVREEVVDLAHGTIEGNDGESMIGGIEDQVLSHDSETNEAEITAGNARMLADVDAGKTCARVSTSTDVNIWGVSVLSFRQMKQ